MCPTGLLTQARLLSARSPLLNLHLLFFLGAVCKGATQGLYDGCTNPSWFMVFNSFLVVLSLAGANRLRSKLFKGTDHLLYLARPEKELSTSSGIPSLTPPHPGVDKLNFFLIKSDSI